MRKYIFTLAFLISSFVCNYSPSQNFERNSERKKESGIVETLEKDSNTIKISSFNIQVFGESKRKNKEVMKVLTDIVRNFDVVAIQEIRDNSKTTLPYFVEQINKNSKKYNFIESERLGRTVSKESYGFVYNVKKVRNLDSYIFDDKNDVFEREPFIAEFSSGKFDYTLVNIHIKPKDAEREIAALEEVVKNAELKFNEKDIIVLGDFNADGDYFSESITSGFRDKKYRWIINDNMDTTLASNSNTYDRIVFQKYTDEDYANKCGVFLFDIRYNLSKEFAKKVSDHYPVWGVFYTNRDSD